MDTNTAHTLDHSATAAIRPLEEINGDSRRIKAERSSFSTSSTVNVI